MQLSCAIASSRSRIKLLTCATYGAASQHESISIESISIESISHEASVEIMMKQTMKQNHEAIISKHEA